MIISWIFSPCSGLVVSGYSKSQTVNSLNTLSIEVIDSYKNFKKMYIVDASGEFKGKHEFIIFYLNFLTIIY